MTLFRRCFQALSHSGVAMRMAVAIGLVMAMYALLVWHQWDSLHHRHSLLVHERLQRTQQRLSGILTLEEDPVAAMATSWTWWDELVEAIEKKDRAWMTANIDPSLEPQNISGLAILDAQGGIVHTSGDPVARALGGSLPVADLLARRLASFSCAIDGRLFSVETGSVHPTADTARATPPRGLLVAFRAWDAERLKRLSEAFGSPISLVHEPDDLSVGVALVDLQGRTLGSASVRLHTTELDELEQQGRRHVALAVAFGIGGALALALAGLLVIGLPLRRLGRFIATSDADAARRIGTRHDELGRVANAVAEAIDQRSRLAVEVRQREQAEDWLREANQQLKYDFEQLATAERALRDAEVRNALAIQGGNLALWEFLPVDQRWTIDQSWLSTLGITIDPSLPVLTAWEAVFDRGDLGGLHERIARITEGRAETVEHTFRLKRDDGGVVWVMLRGMVVERGQDAQALRLAGTMLDVTRWREMEEQLRQAQKMESIGQLAAGIAHEINTPIQFIGDNTRFVTDGFLSYLRLREKVNAILASHPDQDIPARIAAAENEADLAYQLSEVPKALEQTLEGVERVATIVRAMKEFSHPGSVEPVPTDLNHQIENTTVISRNSWKYVANLELRLAADLPLVPLSTGDFNQVLLNLIVNAAQAIEDAIKQGLCQGQGRITIATRLADGHVEMTVADDGIGIPAEIRERIYDPFFTTKEVGRGSGQGLTIARAVIVERHHGTISCASEPGKGATFTVTLPLTSQET